MMTLTHQQHTTAAHPQGHSLQPLHAHLAGQAHVTQLAQTRTNPFPASAAGLYSPVGQSPQMLMAGMANPGLMSSAGNIPAQSVLPLYFHGGNDARPGESDR